jgi:hypothetical protein
MFSGKKRLLKVIRGSWGHSIDRQWDYKLISSYHNHCKDQASDYVNDTTWSDLNMDDVFSLLDRTISPVGSQYLYHILHCYQSESLLKNRFQRYQLFLNKRESREAILLSLKKLERKNAFFIADFIFNKIPGRPKFYIIFYILSAIAILSIPLMFFFTFLILPAFVVFIINLIVEHRYSKKVDSYVMDLSVLSLLLRSGNQIAKIEFNVEQVAFLQKMEKVSNKLLKKIGWLTIDKSRLDELSAIIIEYLNHFCLFNLVSFVRVLPVLSHYQQELREIFNAVASIDAEIAVASYLYENQSLLYTNL